MNEVFLERLREVLGSEQCFTQEDMKKHTTFQAGGPAEYYVRPKRSQIQPVLSLCRQYGIPWMVIGNGSNLLAGDKGIPGVVMEIGRMADGIAITEETLIAEAGALLSSVARQAAQQELAGMEFAAGIPGSVGGAVVMNAGAYGGEMKQILRKVTVLTEEGREKELSL